MSATSDIKIKPTMKKLLVLFLTIFALFESSFAQSDTAILAKVNIKPVSVFTYSDSIAMEAAEKSLDITLSNIELSLLDEIDAYFAETYEPDILDRLFEQPTQVIVYDLLGGTAYEANNLEGDIDMGKLPNGAQFLMKEGSIHYYIILE
jgi:hypothetical protein